MNTQINSQVFRNTRNLRMVALVVGLSAALLFVGLYTQVQPIRAAIDNLSDESEAMFMKAFLCKIGITCRSGGFADAGHAGNGGVRG